MASWTCLLFSTLICIIAGSDLGFVNLKCNVDNRGRLGQQSLLECIVKADVQIKTVDVIAWKKEETVLIEYKRVADPKSEPRFTLAEPRFTLAEPRSNEVNLNVSMLVTNTMMADVGNYTCIVVTDRGDCSSSTSLSLSVTNSSPTIGVSENNQKVKPPSCNDGGCDPERIIAPNPKSQLASKVVPPVVVVLVIIGLLFFLKKRCNKRTHEEIPIDSQDLCNGEHQQNLV